jgi:hypothetical protein
MLTTIVDLKDALREFAKEMGDAMSVAESGVRDDEEVQLYTALERAKLAARELESKLK